MNFSLKKSRGFLSTDKVESLFSCNIKINLFIKII